MHEGVLHIRDVEGPKKTGSVEARLEAMEQQVFKCQGMVERGLNANHMMITEFTNKHKIDANDIGKHLSRLYDRIDHLQAQIYDLQNQNCCSCGAPERIMGDILCSRGHNPHAGVCAGASGTVWRILNDYASLRRGASTGVCTEASLKAPRHALDSCALAPSDASA
ncbi:40S ribosomal protein S5-1 [Hordeum vulgare]|nr:40S ribosomal protein S5-1 [Hordeum vulgare]